MYNFSKNLLVIINNESSDSRVLSLLVTNNDTELPSGAGCGAIKINNLEFTVAKPLKTY